MTTTHIYTPEWNAESDRLWDNYRCETALTDGHGHYTHCGRPTKFSHQEEWSGVVSEVRICTQGHQNAREYEDGGN